MFVEYPAVKFFTISPLQRDHFQNKSDDSPRKVNVVWAMIHRTELVTVRSDLYMYIVNLVCSQQETHRDGHRIKFRTDLLVITT